MYIWEKLNIFLSLFSLVSLVTFIEDMDFSFKFSSSLSTC